MCGSFTDIALTARGSRCPKLSNVGFACCSITSAGVTALARGCPQLKELDVCICNGVDDAALISLADHCTGLVTLKVACTQVGSAGVAQLMAQCPRLEEICLAHCNSVSHTAVHAIAESVCAAATLKVLDISACNAMTATGIAPLIALAKKCPKLETFRLNEIELMSDDVVLEFARHCKQLVHVDVSSCTLLTDRSICPLVTTRGATLRSLHVTDVNSLTDFTVRAIGAVHGKLRVPTPHRGRVCNYTLSVYRPHVIGF